MNPSKLVLAAVASLGLASQAAYAVSPTDLGTMGGGDHAFLSSTVPASGSFSETVNFTLSEVSSLRGLLSAFGISSLSIGLDSPVPLFTFTGTALPSAPFFVISQEAYSFADLAPSITHTLYISGVAARGGAYFSSVAVAAVPEAETWMMIIVGLGLVAFQLQRKQKSLPHHSLPA